jgi:cation diffusion facilitator family transporter
MMWDSHELPPDKERLNARAVKLEWLTVAFFLSAIGLLYLTLGASQAMKTAWVEDILSLIPPIGFLYANRVRRRAPNKRFPYGYHRAVSIAFLCAALALFTFGALLLLDSVTKLISQEHPSIGTVELFGREIWLGWLMIGALAYTTVPAIVLGRLKVPVSAQLHDKVLHADAVMNKADWLTAVAAMLGILGIGLGYWWADSAAAAIISLDIIHDGYRNLKGVTEDLMDAAPRSVDRDRIDPLPSRIETELAKLSFIKAARVRLREEGHVYFGEAWVVLREGEDVMDRLAEASQHARGLDWRLHDLVISPVKELPPDFRESREVSDTGSR